MNEETIPSGIAGLDVGTLGALRNFVSVGSETLFHSWRFAAFRVGLAQTSGVDRVVASVGTRAAFDADVCPLVIHSLLTLAATIR